MEVNSSTFAANSFILFVNLQIVKKKLRLYGLEASLKAYLDSGLLSCTPLTPRDALYVYEVMKTDAKRDGHIYIPFRVLRGHHCFRKLDYQIHGVCFISRLLENFMCYELLAFIIFSPCSPLY